MSGFRIMVKSPGATREFVLKVKTRRGWIPEVYDSRADARFEIQAMQQIDRDLGVPVRERCSFRVEPVPARR